MARVFNFISRLIAREWKEQLHASHVHSYIEIEWPITDGYRTKLISIMGQENYHTKSQVMCFTLESLRDRY